MYFVCVSCRLKAGVSPAAAAAAADLDEEQRREKQIGEIEVRLIAVFVVARAMHHKIG